MICVFGGRLMFIEVINGIIFFWVNGINVNNVVLFIVIGGVVIVEKIMFGFNFVVNVGFGIVCVNGGVFYFGFGGIVKNGIVGMMILIDFFSGIFGVKVDWSMMYLVVLFVGGNIVLCVVDEFGVLVNIMFVGVFFGVGGFMKIGGGMFMLFVVNVFMGDVFVNDGVLFFIGDFVVGGMVVVNVGGCFGGMGMIGKFFLFKSGGIVVLGIGGVGMFGGVVFMWNGGG